jgi:cell division protease FtsH
VTYETEPQSFLGQPMGTTRLYAEETAREIDVAVRETVEAAFARAREILVRNRALLQASAKELLAKETLADADLARVVSQIDRGEPQVAAATPLG